VLVTSQSIDEVQKALSLGRFIVVSISSQSVASIAAKYGIPLLSVWKKLSNFLKTKGVAKVYSIAFGNAIFRSESAAELAERLRVGVLPLLCSSCPGWICYAEKKQSLLLDLISSIKSPQQIMGSLVKHVISPELGWREPYHVAIMPCFDKKLEASRKDFEFNGIRDVDCVLTTSELECMWLDMGAKFHELPEGDLDQELGDFDRANLSSAGGVLEFIIEEYLRNGYSLHRIESKDFVEHVLSKDDEKSIRLVSLYGFKNIQNFIRKIKLKQCKFDYVEVMACPGACIAGAGQLKFPENTNLTKNQVEQSKKCLQSALPLIETEFVVSPWALALREKSLIKTDYHAVESSNFNLMTQW
jgi:iron only hydrogenase large subunit-like protein